MIATDAPTLIEYPDKAAFNRPIPKAKFYERGAVNAHLKGLFVEQVDKIFWQYKLAPETINLPATREVQEIQVFRVLLRTPELHYDVLRCIDAAIPFPILFELSFDGKVQLVASHKRPKTGDRTGRTIRSVYFATPWLPSDSLRSKMPQALNLAALYERLLLRLVPLPQRPGETLVELTSRLDTIHALRKDLDKAVSRLETEKQFNRKVEINASIRGLRGQLRQLGYRDPAAPKHHSEIRKMIESSKVTLANVLEAENLKSLNDLLTQAMKHQQHQELIRDENLGEVVERVVELAASAPVEEELFAGAVMGRLAAVARGREAAVHSRMEDIFTDEPASIDSLADGDEKEYAAKMLAYVDASWREAYCAREALSIDTANNARKELLRVLLSQAGSVAEGIRTLGGAQSVVKTIEQGDTRIKRVRRILESLAEVVRGYEGPVGQEPGSALADLMAAFLRGTASSQAEAIHAAMDAAISILVRVIELRFSHALHAGTYQVLLDGKKLLGQGPWARFLESSSMIQKVHMNLLETALVLARQNRTDKEILRVMEASWSSTAIISGALRRHFEGAVDIDPEVAEYWLKVGRVSQSERAAEHKLGNTEDQQIGELLIQLDANRDNMNKLNRAVVPVLETFDPIQAATVRRAANGYEGIAQVAERLARMRKLSKTSSLGEIVEYNPIEHDMEGGHRSGIRRVRVVRDGILKEFGGKSKTLVKPRVEPEE